MFALKSGTVVSVSPKTSSQHIFDEYSREPAARSDPVLVLRIAKRLGEKPELQDPGVLNRWESYTVFKLVPRVQSGVELSEVPPFTSLQRLPRVLVIEDEASAALGARETVEDEGVDATTVATTAEALTLVRHQPLRPDALLLLMITPPWFAGCSRDHQAPACRHRPEPPVSRVTGDTRSQTTGLDFCPGCSCPDEPFSAGQLLEA